MNKLNLLIIGSIVLLVTLSCTTIMKGKEEAQAGVSKFHSQFNERKFSQIFDDSDEEFRSTVTKEQLTELLEAVHRKLGSVKNSNQVNWKVQTTPSGTFARVTYQVDFSEGKGTEEFVFRVSDGKAQLVSYNVNSPLLITK